MHRAQDCGGPVWGESPVSTRFWATSLSLMLRCWEGSAQDVEGLVGGDPFAFDEDASGLADDRSGEQGALEVVESLGLLVVGLGGGESLSSDVCVHGSVVGAGGVVM